MKILNLTPHAITVKSATAEFTLQSVGCARATTQSVVIGDIAGIPVMDKRFGEVYGLPENVESDTILIVSSLTAQAAKATNHHLKSQMYIVNDTLRDSNGRIVACTSFAKV